MLVSFSTVADDRESMGDEEDSDEPDESDPDVAGDGKFGEEGPDGVDDRVAGWFSANQATGPGIVTVGTNAELMDGRKISG